MRPYQSNQEDEDPDIKKIKKVVFGGGGAFWLWASMVISYLSCSVVFATLSLNLVYLF